MKKHEQSLFARIFLKPIFRKIDHDGIQTGGINLLQLIIILIIISAVLAGLEYCGVLNEIVRMVR